MHTMWKGSISFGLVNIPVKMFSATEDKDIRFRHLHKECGTPIKYVKMCPSCNREIETAEIVKGYEYEKGRFVIIQDEDIEAITPETRKTIEILDFVSLEQIDPIYFDKTYFLSPNETGDKAYTLLREAMNRTGKIAIAKITIRSKESLAAVRLYHNCIVMETIFYPDEVRSIEHVPGLPGKVELNESEMNMAVQLIENLATDFNPEKYTDEYRSKLTEMIHAKIEGEEIQEAPEAPRLGKVVDLMAALQASIEATKQDKAPAAGTAEAAEAKEPAKKRRKKVTV
ncbi:Ku protein [Ammoniphilus sp. CFH 90114]|uniref:non-homologous end joining protein Ku n=1 Tax=Ammoniphilus sp. CFH 90114 TaxID=2493665 RepID=UPI00100EC004|nr:Ku protein [Ammoniphilus sp. CFH 90114]RXT13950.1 Ku protein [Ammoniphilus sp. CFH 90114]